MWHKDGGWQRIDPTDMIAPERISSGLQSYLETQAANTDPGAARNSTTAAGWREFQRDLRLLWDSINYQWDLRVLNFDEDTQRNFLVTLGLGAASWSEIIVWVVIVIAVMLVAIAWWLRRPSRAGFDEVKQTYAKFCRELERAGLPREAWEGPQHFGERAAEQFAAHADTIRQITALYIQLRYSATAPDSSSFLQAVRRLPRLERTKSGT